MAQRVKNQHFNINKKYVHKQPKRKRNQKKVFGVLAIEVYTIGTGLQNDLHTYFIRRDVGLFNSHIQSVTKYFSGYPYSLNASKM